MSKSACRHYYSVHYVCFLDMMNDCALFESPSARISHLKKFSKYDVLIIDKLFKDVSDEESHHLHLQSSLKGEEDKHSTIFIFYSQHAPAQLISGREHQ